MQDVSLGSNDAVALPVHKLIPAGSFLMGSADPDASPYEQPIHHVYIDAFAIDTTLITNAQFACFTSETCYVTTAERKAQSLRDSEIKTWRDYAGDGREEHPVVCISYGDACVFCTWRSKKTGLTYRLPTEAEWEKAARGGLEQKLYPWGDELPNPGEKACWHRWMEDIGTLPAGRFAPNDYGLYDMAGNVWEWCSDWYDNDYYAECAKQGTVDNPTGPTKGTFKTRRGAAWNIGEPFRMRCANRGAMPPEQFWPNLGFRCVCETSQK